MSGLPLALSIGAIAGLIVPLCGAIVALLRVRADHYVNTVRILGIMFISTAICMAAVGMIGALARGEQPVWPYLVMTGLPALAVAKIVQTQTTALPRLQEKRIDDSR
ncbi:MAG: hypothetical protein IT324_30625 [Anaerolineae bacterium]|nr:hypothetical protein [Anaerolineae bacterium]